MGYFTRDAVQVLNSATSANSDGLKQEFLNLHKKILEQIQVNDITLNTINSPKEAVHSVTVSHFEEKDVLAVQYTRPRGKAVTVERLMGREEVASANNIILRLHPVIELRLSESDLALELIMSPDAWWDQQNLKGKLSVSRHRHEFYTMLMGLQSNYSLGFWQGIHLSDMHLTGKYFQHPRILDEWLGTFHPNADWFRLGIWYDLEDERLAEGKIVPELMEQLMNLYPIYEYFLWTSDNNFRDFGS